MDICINETYDRDPDEIEIYRWNYEEGEEGGEGGVRNLLRNPFSANLKIIRTPDSQTRRTTSTISSHHHASPVYNSKILQINHVTFTFEFLEASKNKKSCMHALQMHWVYLPRAVG